MRPLHATCLLALAAILPGCAVVTTGVAVVSTAASVTVGVASTAIDVGVGAVKITGKASAKVVDVLTPGSPQPPALARPPQPPSN